MFSEVPAPAKNSVSISKKKIWLNLKDVVILSVTGNQEAICVDNSSS